MAQETTGNVSSKNGVVCLILALLLGCFGIHRFYVGKVGTGILTIILFFGVFGIWPLIDAIMVLMGKFTDADGKIVKL